MRTSSVVTNIAATAGLGPAAPPRRALALLVVVLVTTLVAASALLRTAETGEPAVSAAASPPSPAGPLDASRSGSSGGKAQPGTVGLGRALPTRLLIPAIEVDARIAPLALGDNGLTGAPAHQLVGWYRHGTSPGELGSAVLLGQLDSPRAGMGRAAGAAVAPALADLAQLTSGDQIEVLRADGMVATFQVAAVEPYRTARVEPGAAGEAQLRLVGARGTGPQWRPHLVVFATLVP